MAVTLNGTSGVVFNDGSTQDTAATGFGFKNRIINGAMMIDQRNNGAEVNPAVTSTYYLDRWVAVSNAASKFKIGQNAGAVTPPTGFTKYLGCTSLSAYTVGTSEAFAVRQAIEGFNIADLAFGTASAATVTLSFWVRSSLTGTFGAILKNNGGTRTYPFTYTISSANTWEQKTLTIAGDTSGTWVTTNDVGLFVQFSLGAGATTSGTAGAWSSTNYNSATGAVSVVGTNGATFYITGVQLEKGSIATSFDYRPYGTEFALCQRYYWRYISQEAERIGAGLAISTTAGEIVLGFPVPMRAEPTSLEQSGTASDYTIRSGGGITACSSVPTFLSANTTTASLTLQVASGLTVGQAIMGRTATAANTFLAWSAEL